MSVTVITTLEQWGSFINSCLVHPWVAIDLETTGLDPYRDSILLVSIACPESVVVGIVPDLGPESLHALRPLLEAESVCKLMHNALFDAKFLYHYTGVMTVNMYCTRVAEQVLTAGLSLSSSLKEVAQRRLGLTMDKDIRESFIGKVDTVFTAEQLLYSADDVRVLYPIYEQQRREIEEQDLQRVIDLEMRLLPIVIRMEYEGVCIDVEKLLAAIPDVKRLIMQSYRALQKVALTSGFSSFVLCDVDTYTTFPPGKTIDLLRHLGVTVDSTNKRELVEWDVEHKTAKRKRQVSLTEDDDAFLAASIHRVFEHPVLQLLHVYKTAQKLHGTYLEGLLHRVNPVTGRIHPGFIQCGASATGRFSSSNPNFQNLPNKTKLDSIGLVNHDVRSVFIPSPGRLFIISDYSGIELAILAALSKDEQLIHQIIEGDIHTFVAMSLYGDAIVSVLGSPITKENRKHGVHKQVRDLFKPVSYAICYGSTGYNLYRVLNPGFTELGFTFTRQLADEWVYRWKHELFPRTGPFFDACAKQAITQFYTTSVLGRRRRWDPAVLRSDTRRYHAAAREGMNQPIQSSSADMTKLAMVLVAQHLDPRKARIVASIHDELLVEADSDYAEEAAGIVQTYMEKAGYDLFPDAPHGLIKAEPKLSTCYDK